MHYLFQPLTHIRNVSHWAKTHGARHRLDIETFKMEVDFNQQILTLMPRFQIHTEAGLGYSPVIGTEGHFVGWLPYALKRWPIASDKLKFKEYCENTSLPIPSYWFQGEAPTTDFILKDRKGSFGQGISGPFTPDQFSAVSSGMKPGFYSEQFIDGDAIKAWYWNDTPIFLERLPPRFLIGDGVRSIRDIAASKRGSFDLSFNIGNDCHDYLAWQGMNAESVPEKNQKVKLGYRYASDFDPITVSDRSMLQSQSKKIPQLRRDLDHFGKVLFQAIPLEIRQHTMFTLDAVINANNEFFLLEVNCNPMVHPLSYVHILDDIFGVKTPPMPAPQALRH